MGEEKPQKRIDSMGMGQIEDTGEQMLFLLKPLRGHFLSLQYGLEAKCLGFPYSLAARMYCTGPDTDTGVRVLGRLHF